MKNNKRANETATSVRKDMRMEKDLLALIDAVRGDVPFAAWVKRAIKMRLEKENVIRERTVKSVPIKMKIEKENINRDCTIKSVPIKKSVKVLIHNPKVKKISSSNMQRSIKTKKILFDAIKILSVEEKIAIIKARYPKSELRKAIGDVVSKDSIAKYWDEIERSLNN
ncbi:hypothetical protein GRJ22_18405 [Photobacterium carnosum]|uniref:hypothetical protein n=1 Tax=Photobacterium carnosum TaxID=2023717 RepID=UPI001E639C31|nr:hypothetical protein [Photobacterium carnosum]MCD9539558.1 hypothetical protein [Photobacterium carnosum]MCD9554847.1 hypothetical protein [Photobacterium carnosum]MCD9558345.1 hypothetical protein [Photobacterium carnosum]MCF2163998.1 hypothetical protein [Photobacterium carnosum]